MVKFKKKNSNITKRHYDIIIVSITITTKHFLFFLQIDLIDSQLRRGESPSSSFVLYKYTPKKALKCGAQHDSLNLLTVFSSLIDFREKIIFIKEITENCFSF